ncbi:pertactin-like passenger domain-containing protein [Bartonella sp. B17]
MTNGAGNHTVNITDFGIEITTPLLSALNLITDLSGKADFTFKDHIGAKVNTVDSGTYMYSLQQKKGNNKDEKFGI